MTRGEEKRTRERRKEKKEGEIERIIKGGQNCTLGKRSSLSMHTQHLDTDWLNRFYKHTMANMSALNEIFLFLDWGAFLSIKEGKAGQDI